MQKKIEIFTVNYCPYCKKALAFLKENDIEKPESIINKPLINAINQMPAAQDPMANFSK